MSLFGSFSESGNTASFLQGSRRGDVSAGTPWWYESASQINATLPDAVTGGAYVIATVRNMENIESNGQIFWVDP